MGDHDSEPAGWRLASAGDQRPEQLANPVSSQSDRIDTLALMVDRLERNARLQRVLGPLLLLVLGLLTPLAEIRTGDDDETPLVDALLPLLAEFTDSSASSFGDVSDYPIQLPLGFRMVYLGLLFAMIAVGVLLVTCWALLGYPERTVRLVVTIAAAGLVVSLLVAMAGIALLPHESSAWQPGTALLLAAGIWLIIGSREAGQ